MNDPAASGLGIQNGELNPLVGLKNRMVACDSF